MEGAPTVGAPTAAPSPPPSPAASSRLALPGWPAKEDLTYIKEAITVLLLLLALPWLVVNLLKRPGMVLAGAGRRAVGNPR